MRITSIFISLFIVVSSPLVQASPYADFVLVKKSARMMFLLKDGNIMKTYPVSLGANPIGHKIKQGDKRTPEGLYKITGHNKQSQFHYSLRIDYPNENDIRKARQRGVNPGGDIYIHGTPNWHRDPQAIIGTDWTAGCVATSNKEIMEISRLIKPGTPIQILP